MSIGGPTAPTVLEAPAAVNRLALPTRPRSFNTIGVVLRESGGPSTPRLLDSIIGVSGILDRPVKPGDDE